MQKKILLILLFTLPYILTAKGSNDYCMYIDNYNFDKINQTKITSTLNDVAYPSIKIQNNKLLIFSGRFQNQTDAQRLLALTKSRYPNAKIDNCTNAISYTGQKLFRDSTPFLPKNTEKKYQEKISNNYCIKVFESDARSNNKQNQIKYILGRLPDTQTVVQDNKFIIYSGNFSSRASANIIAKVLKKEFRSSKVTLCPVAKKEPVMEPINIIAMEESFIEEKFEQEFNVLDLDIKGYISSELSSGNNNETDSNLEKSDITQAFYSQRDEYFNGLYLRTNTAYDFQNSTSAYSVNLEFDLFQQGYYENKKKVHKNKINNRINFYRALQNIEVLKKGQELLKIKKYENSIQVASLFLKLQLAEKDLLQSEMKIEKGLVTEYEHESYTLAVKKIQDELLLYKNTTLLKIPTDLLQLLNDIENTQLVSTEKILQKMQKDSVNLKLVQALKEQQPLGEEWTDKLRVNFYAGVRKLYLTQNQTLLGVEAKIPLANYSKTKELNNIQNNVMSHQTILQ